MGGNAIIKISNRTYFVWKNRMEDLCNDNSNSVDRSEAHGVDSGGWLVRLEGQCLA